MPRLDPKLFGHPNGRARTWRICFRRDKKKWCCDYSFQELVEKLLAAPDQPLRLDYKCYLVDSGVESGCVREESLTRSEGWKKTNGFQKVSRVFQMSLLMCSFSFSFDYVSVLYSFLPTVLLLHLSLEVPGCSSGTFPSSRT